MDAGAVPVLAIGAMHAEAEIREQVRVGGIRIKFTDAHQRLVTSLLQCIWALGNIAGDNGHYQAMILADDAAIRGAFAPRDFT